MLRFLSLEIPLEDTCTACNFQLWTVLFINQNYPYNQSQYDKDYHTVVCMEKN